MSLGDRVVYNSRILESLAAMGQDTAVKANAVGRVTRVIALGSMLELNGTRVACLRCSTSQT